MNFPMRKGGLIFQLLKIPWEGNSSSQHPMGGRSPDSSIKRRPWAKRSACFSTRQGRAVQNLMGGHRPIWGSNFFSTLHPRTQASAVWVGAKQGVQGAVALWRGSGEGASRKILKIRSSKIVGTSIYNTLCQKTSNWSRKPLYRD